MKIRSLIFPNGNLNIQLIHRLRSWCPVTLAKAIGTDSVLREVGLM